MPRLYPRRAGRAASAALALLVLALPPEQTHAALASAAASAFEAAPFVFGAALLPRGLALAAPLLTCGCGGRLPGALSLPAIGLCWVTFGPAATLARLFAALLAATLPRLRRKRSAIRASHAPAQADPLADLGAIALAAFAGALLDGQLTTSLHRWWPGAAFLAGALAGALLPCATAGLAAAGALRSSSPAAATGLLSTAGILGYRLAPPCGRQAGAAAAVALTVCAGLWLSAEGARGFLNPRLFWLAPAGVVTAAATLARRPATRLRAPALLPLALLAALALGSPAPDEGTATLPLGLYPGRGVDFTGSLRPGGRTVERAVILCCRADAEILELPLAAALRLPPGTWIRVRGTIESLQGGLALRVTEALQVSPPRDPYAYL
jgi:hypothetical protein